MKPLVTVFLGTHNRLETLQRTIASYRRLRTPHEIVIVDNGTSDPRCVALLERLEPKVKRIYHLPACISMEEATDSFNIAMRDTMERGDGAEWFAVTEADVCFDGTHPRALDAYIRLAEETGRPTGPHLRVDADIPAHYPLRSRVLACETWMQYAADHEWLEPGSRRDRLPAIPYLSCQIDTTFHLFTARRSLNRLHMDPLRVGPPYDAMHLDWYLNIHRPNRENGILIPDERPMGSWGKAWLRDYWGWYQRLGAEVAFEFLMGEPTLRTDLCNVSFIRSWCYQYGVGVEASREESERWLADAIPFPNNRYWLIGPDWQRMIYENDYAALGWNKAEAAA